MDGWSNDNSPSDPPPLSLSRLVIYRIYKYLVVLRWNIRCRLCTAESPTSRYIIEKNLALSLCFSFFRSYMYICTRLRAVPPVCNFGLKLTLPLTLRDWHRDAALALWKWKRKIREKGGGGGRGRLARPFSSFVLSQLAWHAMRIPSCSPTNWNCATRHVGRWSPVATSLQWRRLTEWSIFMKNTSFRDCSKFLNVPGKRNIATAFTRRH